MLFFDNYLYNPIYMYSENPLRKLAAYPKVSNIKHPFDSMLLLSFKLGTGAPQVNVTAIAALPWSCHVHVDTAKTKYTENTQNYPPQSWAAVWLLVVVDKNWVSWIY